MVTSAEGEPQVVLLLQLLRATSELPPATSELPPDASEGAHHCWHHCRGAAYWQREAASRKYNLEPKWLRSFRTSKHYEWVLVLNGFGKPSQGPLGEA